MRMMMTLTAGFFLTACHRSDLGLTQLNDLDVAPNSMAGEMPTVEPFADRLTVNESNLWDTVMDVDLHSEGAHGWTMVQGTVDLWDYVDPADPVLEYGDQIILTDDDKWDWVACAGPESGWADFDEEPRNVRITFEDPAKLGLVPEGTDMGGRALGAIVDTSYYGGDASRAVTLLNVR